ncbi:unnamed protein product [Clonostachys solani]|uniref:Uncharacterized protein n=1 Tax=Clonostachys solani TaxID=160281 RepID=A0A9N9W3W8_9HYPO|nr:unnamed protein product [Clonostachys solani]
MLHAGVDKQADGLQDQSPFVDGSVQLLAVEVIDSLQTLLRVAHGDRPAFGDLVDVALHDAVCHVCGLRCWLLEAFELNKKRRISWIKSQLNVTVVELKVAGVVQSECKKR